MTLTVPFPTFLGTVFPIPRRVPIFICDFFFRDIPESNFWTRKRQRRECRERAQRKKQVQTETLSCRPTDSWTFTSYLLTVGKVKKTTGQFQNLTGHRVILEKWPPFTGHFGYAPTPVHYSMIFIWLHRFASSRPGWEPVRLSLSFQVSHQVDRKASLNAALYFDLMLHFKRTK